MGRRQRGRPLVQTGVGRLRLGGLPGCGRAPGVGHSARGMWWESVRVREMSDRVGGYTLGPSASLHDRHGAHLYVAFTLPLIPHHVLAH